MPIYEYQCQECGERLEKLQSISAEPLKECPVCGAPEGLKRLISQTSFVLKGTGWYATDYKSSGASSSSSSKESKPSGETSSSAGSTTSSSGD